MIPLSVACGLHCSPILRKCHCFLCRYIRYPRSWSKRHVMDLNQQGCFITFSLWILKRKNNRKLNVLIEDNEAQSNLVTDS